MREKMKKKRNKESQNEIEIETRRRINEILHKIKENEKDEEAWRTSIKWRKLTEL